MSPVLAVGPCHQLVHQEAGLHPRMNHLANRYNGIGNRDCKTGCWVGLQSLARPVY